MYGHGRGQMLSSSYRHWWSRLRGAIELLMSLSVCPSHAEINTRTHAVFCALWLALVLIKRRYMLLAEMQYSVITVRKIDVDVYHFFISRDCSRCCSSTSGKYIEYSPYSDFKRYRMKQYMHTIIIIIFFVCLVLMVNKSKLSIRFFLNKTKRIEYRH